MNLHRNAWRHLAVLLASASLLSACCTPVGTPESVQPGSGTCGAYIPPCNCGPTGGGQNR